MVFFKKRFKRHFKISSVRRVKIIYISISYVQGTGDTDKAQAKKISIKKAQANAQATRYRRQGSRKVLHGTRLVDFARNNFVLRQLTIVLNCKKTLDSIK